MNLKFYVQCFLLALACAAYAQHEESCKTMQQHQKLMERDALYRTRVKTRTAVLPSGTNARTTGTVYKIPVVVHILHVGSPVGTNENISSEQVYSAIHSLNDAYRKRRGGNGGDAEIEFCLAQRDPAGNPHSGINRIDASAVSYYTEVGVVDSNEIALKALSKWDNTRYYNIWVVSEIDDNDGGTGTQGYAYFPGAPSDVDGTVILYNAFGSDPDGSRGFDLKSFANKNITLIHEIGHAFDLYHTFQGDGANGSLCPTDADCGVNGDCVADTPPHKRSDDDCVGGTNECTGTSRDLFIHNYMDYASEICANEFTTGQIVRMRAAIISGDRMSLAETSNLIACGCNGNAAPITRFSVANETPCVGSAVLFSDESIDFPVSWSWTFEGAMPEVSTNRFPSVLYTGAGSYDVTLTTTSQGGQTHTVTKTNYIAPKPKANTPVSESFSAFIPSGWSVKNPDNDKTWSSITVRDPDGAISDAAYVYCYDYSATGEKDDLILPLVNLEGVQNATLSFYVAHEQYETSVDSLQVLISTDCGVSWISVYKKGSPELETTNAIGENPPTNSDQWRNETVSLSSYAGQPLTIAFRVINGWGNNIYLDNVEVLGTGIGAPIADFNASKTSPSINETIRFTDASYGTIQSYSWNFGPGANLAAGTAGIGPHEVSYATAGTKTVSLTVTGPGGNDTKTITSYITVTVLATLDPGDREAALLYPNPASQKVQLIHLASGTRVILLNAWGQEVAEWIVSDDRVEMDVQPFTQGIYTVVVYENENVFREKLVIQK